MNIPKGSVLCASGLVHRYEADPVKAGETLAAEWSKSPTEQVDLWGCDWPCKAFFTTFLDMCRRQGLLPEALRIMWLVHNAPGPGRCFSDDVQKWIGDYARQYGMSLDSPKTVC